MKLYVLAVRDSAMNAFLRPFVAQSVGMAVRSFSDEVNRPDSEIGKHVSDYELYCVGTFDDASGGLEAQVVEVVARAKDLLKGE